MHIGNKWYFYIKKKWNSSILLTWEKNPWLFSKCYRSITVSQLTEKLTITASFLWWKISYLVTCLIWGPYKLSLGWSWVSLTFHPSRYLINHGANVAAVNSEGEVPADLAEEAAMKDLLLEQVKKQGKATRHVLIIRFCLMDFFLLLSSGTEIHGMKYNS